MRYQLRSQPAIRLTPPRKIGTADLGRSGHNLTRIAYEKIRAAIVYGQLDLGEPVSENDLAKALKMSKAPVRAAMGELRLKGLIKIVPQSGSYVFSPTREEIEQLCDFRFLLEAQAVRSSMEHNADALLSALDQIVDKMRHAHRSRELFNFKRHDTEFHQTFLQHSGNRYLSEAYGMILHCVEALRYRFMDTEIYRKRAFDEHQKMLEILKCGKVTKVIDILGEHISRTRQFQASVHWSAGRALRKHYSFRDYADVFRD